MPKWATSLAPKGSSWRVAETPPPYRPGSPKLLDRVRIAIRTRHMSRKAEKAYVLWIRRFIVFHGKRHPTEMAATEVTAFLSHLAVSRRVSGSTQNQALAAILFLYRQVLTVDLPWLEGVVRAKRAPRVPVVLGRDEIAGVIGNLDGSKRLMAGLLYGCGLRLMECLRNEIIVRAGKGDRDRRTMLPRGR